jgi:integrase
MSPASSTAKAFGFRSGDNPVDDINRALPRQSDRKGHFAALPYAEVPAFVRRLHDPEQTIASLAFEFLILTAARTGELLEAKWSEIDLDQAAWTIPEDRMKAGREHRVHLHQIADQLEPMPVYWNVNKAGALDYRR